MTTAYWDAMRTSSSRAHMSWHAGGRADELAVGLDGDEALQRLAGAGLVGEDVRPALVDAHGTEHLQIAESIGERVDDHGATPSGWPTAT
jgi:hypothetical protein